MRFLSLAILLLVLTIGFAVTENPNLDVENIQNNLNWTDINFSVVENPYLSQAFSDAVNGFGSALFGVAKWATGWAAENPQIPFKLLVYVVLISVLAPLLLIFFKFIVIIVILLREFIQSRREKRELKEMLKK